MIPKFRAFVKSGTKQMYGGIYEEDVMVPVGVLDITGEEVTVWGCGRENCGMCDDYFRMKDIILMQSAPFKAINTGDLVYEGDIVSIHWFYLSDGGERETEVEIAVITKELGNLGFWWNGEDDWVDLSSLAMSVDLHEESFEVLGNIYENPELLEEVQHGKLE